MSLPSSKHGGSTKICNRCNEEKPLAAFSAEARSKDGKRWQCKECDKAALPGRA